jgi:hypothetical protein
VSPERGRRFLRLAAARLWVLAALVVVVAGLVLGANLALLGYAQPRNDPVGQLTPARLMQIERSLARAHITTSPAITPAPPPHDHHIPGERSDD